MYFKESNNGWTMYVLKKQQWLNNIFEQRNGGTMAEQLAEQCILKKQQWTEQCTLKKATMAEQYIFKETQWWTMNNIF